MHENHRERVRQRFLTGGFENFAIHEILESLLFYSIPRGDTNEIAHQLLEWFGSLKGILEASPDELMTVPGIGAQSAMLLKTIPELLRRYAEETAEDIPVYNTVSRIATFFCRQFIGLDHECLYLMLLNNRMNLIDCVRVSEGSVNSSAVPFRTMTEKALLKKASLAVVAHNHPNGMAVPSSNDLEVTELLSQSFDLVGVSLLEHLIIVDRKFYPILHRSRGIFRKPPEVLHVENGFFESFYDVDPEAWSAPAFYQA